jgi:hypothetical protein
MNFFQPFDDMTSYEEGDCNMNLNSSDYSGSCCPTSEGYPELKRHLMLFQSSYLSSGPYISPRSTTIQSPTFNDLAQAPEGDLLGETHYNYNDDVLEEAISSTRQDYQTNRDFTPIAVNDGENMNMFDPCTDHDNSINKEFLEQLLASLYTKRPAEEPPTYYKKMPHKREELLP